MTHIKIVAGMRLPGSHALTENEVAWVEFIRLASCETDPVPTLSRVQVLRQMFPDGWEQVGSKTSVETGKIAGATEHP